MRSRLAETPEFQRVIATRSAQKARLTDIWHRYRFEALGIAGLTAVGSASFYLIMVFLPIFSSRSLGISMSDAQIATIVNSLIQILVCLLGGWLSDRHGRRAILLPAVLAYALICYPLFSYLIHYPSFISLLLVQGTVGLVLGFISGPFPAAISELLPTEIRSSGLGIIYNIIGAVFGGLGPFIMTSLVAMTDDKASPAYWALLTGIIGATAVLLLGKVARREPAAARPHAEEKAVLG
jgi:MFS family permease